MTRARDLAAFVSNADGDIKFDTDTLFIDSSANRVGIGTNTPSADLTVSSSNATIHFNDEDDSTYGEVRNNGGTFTIASDEGAAAANSSINFRVDGSERMRINSDGDVGIGTTNPQYGRLHIADGNSDIAMGTNGEGQLHIDGNGYGFGIALNADGAQIYTNTTSRDLIFGTNETEAMRIDGSRNLLVGKTASSLSAAGLELEGQGRGRFTRDGAVSLQLNRLTSDGDIALFYKNGTAVGSIGSRTSTESYISLGSSGLSGSSTGGGALLPTAGGTNYVDNVVDLGFSSGRFDDIYASNGTIQTSDEREKQNIASLTDAEITAAKAISKLFKTFKWNDKVEAKGDAARTHTGVIAQQVEQAMTDAGLTASNYAFWCSDTWWETQTDVPAVEADEENGIEAQEAYTRTDTYDTLEEAPEGATERNRKGIRYPELLSFIGAATEQRLTSIEARLDALEAE